MALAVPQILASSRNSATSLTRTFAGAVGAGSLLVANGAVFNSGGTGEPTISDTVNGTWTASAASGYSASGDADSEIYLWSFSNSAAGTPAVTMNPPGTSSDNDLTLMEIAGAATSSPRDKSVTNTGTIDANGQPQVTTGTLAQAAEILVSSFSHAGPDRTLTADADSFTQADENENNSAGQAFLLQYKIVAATTSVVVNGTISGAGAFTWFMGVASYMEAVAGGAAFAKPALLHNRAVNRAAFY